MTPSALSPPFGRFCRWSLPNFERPPAAMVPVPATKSEAGPGIRAVTMEAEGMAPPKPPPDLI
jgi:hypothetical protein